MSKLLRRHLRETKLLITNWSLASVDDLYSGVMMFRANLGRAELIHLYAISLHIGAKHQCAIFKRLEKNRPTDFAKSKSFLCSALISKRMKIQEPAWYHLIDFSKMRILTKKKQLIATKIERAMTLLSCLYIYGQNGTYRWLFAYSVMNERVYCLFVSLSFSSYVAILVAVLYVYLSVCLSVCLSV